MINPDGEFEDMSISKKLRSTRLGLRNGDVVWVFVDTRNLHQVEGVEDKLRISIEEYDKGSDGPIFVLVDGNFKSGTDNRELLRTYFQDRPKSAKRCELPTILIWYS